VKKEQNGRDSLRRLKPAAGCNASKRKKRRILSCAEPCIWFELNKFSIRFVINQIINNHRLKAFSVLKNVPHLIKALGIVDDYITAFLILAGEKCHMSATLLSR